MLLVYLIRLISAAFWFFEIFILIRVVFSWITPNPYAKWVRFVYDVTEPFLSFIRQILPSALTSPLDWSPLAAMFLLGFIERFIIRSLVFLMG